VIRAHDHENPLAGDEPLGSRQSVFEHRAATDDSTELFNPTPAAELREKVAYPCPFARR
jgi:hypothetical protein